MPDPERRIGNGAIDDTQYVREMCDANNWISSEVLLTRGIRIEC